MCIAGPEISLDMIQCFVGIVCLFAVPRKLKVNDYLNFSIKLLSRVQVYEGNSQSY